MSRGESTSIHMGRPGMIGVTQARPAENASNCSAEPLPKELAMKVARLFRNGWVIFAITCCVTLFVYSPGLSGGWLFDDYPNIVENPGVQPHQLDEGSLFRAALSSPASDFKRPLASLSFALNYLASGLDPYWMKLSNLLIHLLNGLLVFLLTRSLLQISTHSSSSYSKIMDGRTDITASLIAASWMLLPINLTAVLYVVQRMESMANIFVLLGLIGYIAGRKRMTAPQFALSARKTEWRYFILCTASIVIFTIVGILAKETAIMLPLYAALVEWLLFGFRDESGRRDWRIVALFTLALVLPMAAGLVWQIQSVLNPATWVTRDFTLRTRLLSEARIVVDYIGWTLLPTPDALSFYHDDFHASAGLLSPWSTLTSIVTLAILLASVWVLRRRWPLVSLGIALFLGCHLLTGTILPLELVYEHRNYFASFGLLLALIPLLTAPGRHSANQVLENTGLPASETPLPLAISRYALIAVLLMLWAVQTSTTAYAWGEPLRLAATLADRAPDSPRAQYELGRTYIIYSNYDPASPFTAAAYAPLERAAQFPGSSILPEQALIFMNARMHLPLKDAWWASIVQKLSSHKPTVQDESSISTLVQCVRDRECDLPTTQMEEVFAAALSHPDPSARLLAMYGDYAWNVLGNQELGERMIARASQAAPNEPAYLITLIRMQIALGHLGGAKNAFQQLQRLNIGGRLNDSIDQLRNVRGLE